jgi:hypothetical protein
LRPAPPNGKEKRHQKAAIETATRSGKMAIAGNVHALRLVGVVSSGSDQARWLIDADSGQIQCRFGALKRYFCHETAHLSWYESEMRKRIDRIVLALA